MADILIDTERSTTEEAKPVALDFLGRPIARPVACEPAGVKLTPPDDPATDAWLAAHKPKPEDEASTLFDDPEPDPAFNLAEFIDLTRPVDYFVLHDAYSEACDALCGPQFRVAIKQLGPVQVKFWERMMAAHYFKIIEGKEKPPTGYLLDETVPESEQPTEARPFLWWLSLWR